MGARGNFGDFDHALNDFTAKALAATDPPADAQKKAYAALYAKQFRYDFYREYQQKNFNPPAVHPGRIRCLHQSQKSLRRTPRLAPRGQNARTPPLLR